MPVVHLASIDALEGEAFADDAVHVHGHRLIGNAQKAYFAAVAHDRDHLGQGSAVAAHFQADVKALHQPLLVHNPCQIFILHVDRRIRAHFPGQVQAVVIYVGDHHPARPGIFADAHSDNANRPGPGDKHVLPHQVPHKGGVGGVAKGIEKGNHLFVKALVNDNDIALGDAYIFGKSAVPVYPHAFGVPAPLDVPCVAVAAAPAGDVPFAADPLAYMQARNPGAQLCHLAHILVADNHGRLDMLPCPGIPVIDMYVRSADSGFVNLDKHFSRPRVGHRHLAKLQAWPCCGFYQRVHELRHNCPPVKYTFRFLGAFCLPLVDSILLCRGKVKGGEK